MKISKRGEYALRALIDIGIASELGHPLIQIGALADKEKLPVKFLEQILTQLKEGGFIDSKRGKHGGYFLSLPMEDIRFGAVIRHIDGPLAPINCVSQTAYERCSCPDEDHCGLRMLMLDVRNAIANILDRYTLADTVEITLRKMRRDKVALPFMEALFLGAGTFPPEFGGAARSGRMRKPKRSESAAKAKPGARAAAKRKAA